ITQLFFDPTAYSRLRRRAVHAGITIPIIPGILPITDARRLHTMSRLSGLPVPDHLLARFDGVSDPASARRIGLDITAEHTAAILDQDADGLHFYTFNDQNTTEDLLTALDERGASLSPFPPPPPPRRRPPSSETQTTTAKKTRSCLHPSRPRPSPATPASGPAANRRRPWRASGPAASTPRTSPGPCTRCASARITAWRSWACARTMRSRPPTAITTTSSTPRSRSVSSPRSRPAPISTSTSTSPSPAAPRSALPWR